MENDVINNACLWNTNTLIRYDGMRLITSYIQYKYYYNIFVYSISNDSLHVVHNVPGKFTIRGLNTYL